MQLRPWLALVAVLLLTVSCVSVPPGTSSPLPTAAPAAVRPPAITPTTAASSVAPTPGARNQAGLSTPIAATPATSATPAPGASNGWQTYTNLQVPFTISYPPTWTQTELPVETGQPMQGVALEGPEGRIELQWGTGFGGACIRYSVLHTAQGQIPVCHTVGDDGTQHWEQIYKKLDTVTFGGRGFTKNAEPASADGVLAVLATLSFGAGGARPAPEQSEVVLDNAGPDFWPSGNWYVLDAAQKSGADCYEALPGLQAYADVRPNLPQAGLYEVSAWWCGNPHFDQTNRGTIEVHRAPDDVASQPVSVNYQEGAGQWQSLGVYNLEPGAFLRVRSAIDGNVVADAYRFAPITGEGASGGEVVPTPLPSAVIVSNHPPSPLEQLTSGDLAARLGLRDPFYTSVPMTATQTTFDDCRTFPREGCAGTRDGSQAIVSHQGITLTYRVSNDYKLVTVEGADVWLDPTVMGQERPQRVFMTGSGGGYSFRLLYYPDNTWHVLRGGGETTTADDMTLSQDQVSTVRSLVSKYSTLYLDQPSGDHLVFYGIGPNAGPTAADRDALLALGSALSAPPIQ